MFGTDLSQWTPRERPSAKTHNGKFVRLEKLDPARHGDDLWVALQGPEADPKQWDFLLDGPYPDRHSFNQYLQNKADSKDPFAFAVVNVSNGKAEGLLCFMEIAHTTGSIEIGYVTFGACMQRSPKSTEALYLLMKEAFDLGYRRLEWTCYSANERSKQAALRFGFSYEGTLRQRYVHKGGRNRDDCYLAILDYEWPAINGAFEKWFSDENLSASGQVRKLSELILEERGPARSVANFPTPVTGPVPNWKPAQWPSVTALEGHYVRLETLDPAKHGDHLWAALNGPDADPNMWEFIPYGPFETRSSFDEYLKGRTGREDSVLFAVIDKKTGVAEGLLGLLYILAKHGRLVIGHATYGNGMRRSPKGTEAVYLLLKEAFSTGYRRVEWRCNNENERSKQAAERLGFTLEVVHLQHMVLKGKNRDSAMYSIIDKEWPAIRAAYEKWLAAENQAANGQAASLSELITVAKQSGTGGKPTA